MNNKDFRNRAIALAVVATMTVPEAASVGAEVVNALQDAPEQAAEEVVADEDVAEEVEPELVGDTIDVENVGSSMPSVKGKFTATDSDDATSVVEAIITVYATLDDGEDFENDWFSIVDSRNTANKLQGFKIASVEVVENYGANSNEYDGNKYDIKVSIEVKKSVVVSYFAIDCKIPDPAGPGHRGMGTYTVAYAREITEVAPFSVNLTKNLALNAVFDYFAPDTDTFAATVTIPGKNLDAYEAGDVKIAVDKEGKSTDGISNIVYTQTDAGIKVDFKVAKAFAAKNIYILDKAGNANKFSIVYSSTLGALRDDEKGVKGTSIDANGVLTYNGTSDILIIKQKYGAKTVTGVKIESISVGTVVVPAGVTAIESNAFPDTVSTVILPDSVNSIASDAFAGRTTKVYYNGSANVKTAKKQVYGSKISSDSNLAVTLTKNGISTDIEGMLTIPACKVPVKDNAVDGESIKWVVETTDGKASALAKFKSGETSAATVNGTSVTVKDLKASGLYNSIVVVKAVNKTNPDIVYAYVPLIITPAKVSEIEVKADGTKIKPKTDNSKTEFDVTVDEGGSFKIPATAKDGADKTLVYKTTSNNITVINGTIKGITPSENNVVYVYPQDDSEYTSVNPSSTAIKLNVKVNAKAAASAVVTDVKSISIVNNTPSAFNVKTPNGNVTFEYDDNLFTIKSGNTVIANNGAASPGAFTIARKDNNVAIGSKCAIKITDSVSKKASISVSLSGTYQNITKVVEPNAKKLIDDSTVNAKVSEINMVEGSSMNLGISVLPAAVTQADLNWYHYDSANNGFAPGNVAGLSASGNTITAGSAGTYYFKAEVSGEDAAGNKPETSIYKINVYKTGGSIAYVPTADDKYVIQGGALISKEQSATLCSKNIEGGSDNTIVMTAPVTLGNKEDITWTSSNSAGLCVECVKNAAEKDQLKLSLIQPGSYTVTGISKYTKQKFSFKVNVVAPSMTSGEFGGNSATIEVLDGNEWKDASAANAAGSAESKPYELAAGGSIQIRPVSAACGKVSYASADTTKVTVDAKGIIKVKAADDTAVKITATITQISSNPGTVTKDIYIKPVAASAAGGKTPEIALVVPSSVQAGDTVTAKATAKNFADKPTIAYTVKKKTSSGWADAAATDCTAESDGKINFLLAGEYKVIATAGSVSKEQEVNVYDVLAKSVAVHPEDVAKVKRLGTAGKGIAGSKSMIIDLYATGSVKVDGKTSLKVAADDEITWTSSNTYLATASSAKAAHGVAGGVHTSEEVCDKDDAYGHSVIITANDKGYTGTVILTGTFKNSGKKVSVKVNIKP